MTDPVFGGIAADMVKMDEDLQGKMEPSYKRYINRKNQKIIPPGRLKYTQNLVKSLKV